MKTRSVDIEFQDFAENQFSFTQLSDLHEFLTQEKKYWKSAHEAIESVDENAESIIQFHNRLDTVITNLENIMDGVDDLSDDQFAERVRYFIQNNIQQFPGDWLWSKSSISLPFIECNKIHGEKAASNFIYLILRGRAYENLQEMDGLVGAISAYEYLMQGSEIVSRRRSEKISLGKLRNELFSEKQNLVSEIEEIKADFDEWDNEARETVSKIQRISKRLAARQRKMQESSFSVMKETWNKEIQNLEHSYTEKLRLSKPAAYWEKSAKRYARHGYWWIAALTVFLGVGIWLFYSFFITWLQGAELAIELQSVQGLVLFGTGAAIYAYFVKVLSKLVFSSFHLTGCGKT